MIVDTQLRPTPGGDQVFGFPADGPLADDAAEDLTQLLKLLQRKGRCGLASHRQRCPCRTGCAVEPGDIDICLLGGRQEALSLCELMRPYLISPLRDLGDLIRARWFSRAWLGLAVEWIAEPDPDADSVFARDGRVCEWGRVAITGAEVVEWNGRPFQVPPLDLQGVALIPWRLPSETA
jgi:hypothetical protein